MIPIRDTIPTRTYPIVNNALIAINVVAFLVELSQGPGLERFIYMYGLVPARYTIPQIASYFTTGQQLVSLITFMFLHGGFWHILGNMWSLYIFGDNIEERLGPLRYLVFYMICGFASGISHLVFNYNSTMPTIGASGAIAGVMGAYFILFPKAKILTLIPIFFIPYFIEIPAFFFLGIWFVFQFLSATGNYGQMAGIAWWAHIGGFIFGIIFIKLFLALPGGGVSKRFRKMAEKKKSYRLKVIRPVGMANNPNLYGTITITHLEAITGTLKLVNIPWGFQKRLFKVIVPPGIKEGSLLKLRGLGKDASHGQRGDLLLKVAIQ
ncbi:MAG: rhomboid family intramembrane serine protease [Desulfobacteraceae bacterium]|nr:rhomboid family intramembrane serine protease [Desulfobacteraceae bacterium]MBC2718881.1 rhomboid family intramembrane serine protease [Desulfobacteraceae bacterium]